MVLFPPAQGFGGGAASSGGGGVSAAAYGPYVYYVTESGANYIAYNNAGVATISPTTDIWALFNSIDALQPSGSVTYIYVARGTFTGTTTFEPSVNRGYYIVGEGRPAAKQVAQVLAAAIHK